MTKLERLEKQLTAGIGTISWAEGQALFFAYVHEVLRLLKRRK